MLMSHDNTHLEHPSIEIMLPGGGRRRRWSADAKLVTVEESFEARGGAVAVTSDERVVGTSEVKRLERQVRELERMLGKKTMKNEILREALGKAD